MGQQAVYRMLIALFTLTGVSGILWLALPPAAPSPMLAPASTPTPTASTAVLFPIDINEATPAELEALPRIGPVLAEHIVAYRQANGAFAATADLMRVDGIGQATYDRLRDLVTVGD
ncbi:MAG: ComEA family DNA-binding protein [SAR202 cluster bacterium]|nr:ComEA family DNA-binding protein [SAR202 cluster bacterium]